jgi:hypothetical protein
VDSLADVTVSVLEYTWPEDEFKKLSLSIFVKEILRRSKTSYTLLLLALLYMLRTKYEVDCKRRRRSKGQLRKRASIGRKYLLASLILAGKYLQDANYSMHTWSKLSGLSRSSIVRIERDMLSLLDFRLHVDVELYESWSKFVLECVRLNKKPLPDQMELYTRDIYWKVYLKHGVYTEELKREDELPLFSYPSPAASPDLDCKKRSKETKEWQTQKLE